MTVKVLLTGFEPFGEASNNPSMAIAQSLDGVSGDGYTVHSAILPVERYRCTEVLASLIETHTPDVIIALGVAAGRSQITPEKVAINFDDYRIADNAGNQPIGEAISTEGPNAYFSSLPINSMTKRLLDRELPAVVSFTAGTFVCNHLMYGLLEHIERQKLNIRAGFIHIPQADEFVAEPSVPSIPLANMTDAIAQCIEVASKVENDQSIIAGHVA